MLKFTYLKSLGILGLIAAPPVLQSGGSSGLDAALEQTLAALDELTATKDSVTSGDYGAVEALLGSTETPVAAPEEASAIRQSLREEVSKLQMELDQLTSREVLTPIEPANGSAPDRNSTGLSEEQRRSIGGILVPIPGGGSKNSEVLEGRGPATFEREGFSAHYARHGRAYYRAGRFQEGVSLLRHAPESDVEATYWRGRCLERLGRLNEAVLAYTTVADDPHAGALAERAKEDRGFVEWKIRFSSKIEDTVERRMREER